VVFLCYTKGILRDINGKFFDLFKTKKLYYQEDKKMKADMVKNFIVSAVISAVITALIVGLIIGEKGVPSDVMGNVMGNIITAVICGGISGLATTIILYKKLVK